MANCPDWIKNKKTAISPINSKDNKYFQYTVTLALTNEEIGKTSERITKIETFMNNYNWERISFSSEKDGWKKFEKNNVAISLNVFYAKKEKSYPAYKWQQPLSS